MRMQFLIPFDGLDSLGSWYIRVVWRVAGDLIAHLIGHIICQHIQNKAFFDGLFHGIDVEGVEGTIRIWLTEDF